MDESIKAIGQDGNCVQLKGKYFRRTRWTMQNMGDGQFHKGYWLVASRVLQEGRYFDSRVREDNRLEPSNSIKAIGKLGENASVKGDISRIGCDSFRGSGLRKPEKLLDMVGNGSAGRRDASFWRREVWTGSLRKRR
jgi:hypothetical protein